MYVPDAPYSYPSSDPRSESPCGPDHDQRLGTACGDGLGHRVTPDLAEERFLRAAQDNQVVVLSLGENGLYHIADLDDASADAVARDVH